MGAPVKELSIREQRIEQAKRDLRELTRRVPFDFQAAGATRLAAYRKLAERAVKSVERQHTKPDDLEKLVREIRALATASPESCAAILNKG